MFNLQHLIAFFKSRDFYDLHGLTFAECLTEVDNDADGVETCV